MPECDNSTSGLALVNKHLVLPFIPPKFTSSGDCLIKPSEYLKSLGGTRTGSLSGSANGTLVQKSFTKCLEQKLNQLDENKASATNGPPPPPLPAANKKEAMPEEDAPNNANSRKQQQPLSAISIHDLNSVQLRRTDKAVLHKTMSTPVKTSGKSTFFIFYFYFRKLG